jgi:polygalacturonase
VGTFIVDGAAVLPDVKSDARPASIPVGTTEWAAADTNEVRQALLDLRTAAIDGTPYDATQDAALALETTQRIAADAAEASARAAADAAIIASGATPASVGLAPVIATGSTQARAVQDRFVDILNVRDFGAVGDGVTNDQPAIQAACNAVSAGGAVYFPPGEYVIAADHIDVTRSDVTIFGHGAKITQNTANTVGFYVSASRVTIDGLWIYRSASDWTAVQTITQSCGVWITDTAFDVTVQNCRIENWGCAGVYQNGTSTSFAILSNTIIGVGAAGGLVTLSNYNFGVCFYLVSGANYRIEGNTFRELAQGIFVGPNRTNVVISGNLIRGIVGQHGMYLDAGSNFSITGNVVENCAANGIKLQMQAGHTADAVGITVTGNSVANTTQAGIIAVLAPATTYYFRNLVISGNAVTDAGTDGIYVDYADGWLVANNVIRNAGTFGIRLPSAGKCRSGRIAGNVIDTTQGVAITLILESDAYLCVVEDNLLLNPCVAGSVSGAPASPVYLGIGEFIFRNNTVRSDDTSPWTNGSLYVTATATVTLGGNTIAASAAGVTFLGTLASSPANVLDFGADPSGVTNSTAAIQDAVNAAALADKSVYAPAGRYLIDTVTLPDKCCIVGDGIDNTVFVQGTPSGASRGSFWAQSSSSTTFLTSITLRDFTMYGFDNATYTEFTHLLTLQGCIDPLVERVKFYGWRGGDAIYIGSGATGGLERHNKNVIVRDCVFDGVDKDNRQGISVIDGDGVLIDGCYFARCTASGQPGAIDVEPDAYEFHICRNIKITNNSFYDVGEANTASVVNFLFPDAAWMTPPRDFWVVDNHFEACPASNCIVFNSLAAGGPTADSVKHGLIVSQNRVVDAVRPLSIFGCSDALVTGNYFNGTSGVLIGYTDAANDNRDIRFLDNTFDRVGSVAGYGITVFSVVGLSITRNQFIDCGSGVPGASNGINFSTGTSSYVRLQDNTFTAPNSKTLVAVAVAVGHTLTPTTNYMLGNNVGALGNAFMAQAVAFGGWNDNCLSVNSHWLWGYNGKLYIKWGSAPTSSTDGTVVGTQT